jgi:hypothetical protein
MATAPKPAGQRRRRNATPGFVQIDPVPRTEPAPAWPLNVSAIEAYRDLEQARWEELWELPQAREWERMKCFRSVALYVRLEVICTYDVTNNPKLLTELRQLDNSIGVTPKALQGLRWEIAQPQDDETKPAATLHSVDRRAYVPAAG